MYIKKPHYFSISLFIIRCHPSHTFVSHPLAMILDYLMIQSTVEVFHIYYR
jgi:hypothetical protein